MISTKAVVKKDTVEKQTETVSIITETVLSNGKQLKSVAKTTKNYDTEKNESFSIKFDGYKSDYYQKSWDTFYLALSDTGFTCDCQKMSYFLCIYGFNLIDNLTYREHWLKNHDKKLEAVERVGEVISERSGEDCITREEIDRLLQEGTKDVYNGACESLVCKGK